MKRLWKNSHLVGTRDLPHALLLQMQACGFRSISEDLRDRKDPGTPVSPASDKLAPPPPTPAAWADPLGVQGHPHPTRLSVALELKGQRGLSPLSSVPLFPLSHSLTHCNAGFCASHASGPCHQRPPRCHIQCVPLNPLSPVLILSSAALGTHLTLLVMSPSNLLLLLPL